ncbi:hypothetical protein [Shinella sp. JR1-6]|uniref:hypothetical protein n=1 Tax=Shinella sp. JR1-6 TaxID=2527671 RepID=UPI00102D5B55|nr:hypothetical protein [Shinella sp. JR1-6]TAA51057.1 hypothetical protein EXZ48_32040 [Shinella sp. JR1-6]
MSMPSGGSSQTQTTSNEPWKPTQDLLKTGLADALNLYKNGVGSDIYTGSTVIPYSLQTMKGMGGLEALANGNTGRGLTRQMGNIIGNGGFNSYQKDALGGLTMAANNAENRYMRMLGNGGFNESQRQALGSVRKNFDANQGIFQNLLNSGGMTDDQRLAMDNYRTTATSKFDPNADPNFQRVLSGALDAAGDSVNLSAAAAGRYGSGAHQGVMGKTTGNLAANMLSDEYKYQMGRKDAANNALFQGGQQGVNNMTGAYGTMQGAANNLLNMGQVGIDNIDRQYGNLLNSQGELFNAGQQGLSNMQNAYNIAQMPYQTLMQVGGMNEDLATRIKNDELRIFDAKNNSPWDQIGRLLNVGNLGGQFSTSKTTASGGGQNPFLTGIGGLGLLGSLFGGGTGGTAAPRL